MDIPKPSDFNSPGDNAVDDAVAKVLEVMKGPHKGNGWYLKIPGLSNSQKKEVNARFTAAGWKVGWWKYSDEFGVSFPSKRQSQPATPIPKPSELDF